ncbi:hypothetical protein E2C01_052075 [Portunus trituberculatus]|uniref:Ig-like domain-containing protein n=1 Tax=Portunus trituberculatus TaxID=210409 RepID=A0A5B7GCN4_PORTR|nr:hypothetical protein [Portunus trituberculatus]
MMLITVFFFFNIFGQHHCFCAAACGSVLCFLRTQHSQIENTPKDKFQPLLLNSNQILETSVTLRCNKNKNSRERKGTTLDWRVADDLGKERDLQGCGVRE